jgi:hypothetical protein
MKKFIFINIDIFYTNFLDGIWRSNSSKHKPQPSRKVEAANWRNGNSSGRNKRSYLWAERLFGKKQVY